MNTGGQERCVFEFLTNDILRSQFVTARSTEYNTDLNLRSQFVTAKDFTKSRTLPYAFTENGVAMLSVGTGTTVTVG